jgi:DNA-binding response OmpR family regulator
MDIRLYGEMDGVSAAQPIYERFERRSVFVTGNDDAEMRARAPTAPLGWIAKPLPGKDLVARLTELDQAKS